MAPSHPFSTPPMVTPLTCAFKKMIDYIGLLYIELTLEQQEFELHESTHRFYSINTQSTLNVFSLPCDFLDTFFSLAYFKNMVYSTYNMQNVLTDYLVYHVMLSQQTVGY